MVEQKPVCVNDNIFSDSAELVKRLSEINIEGTPISEYLKFKEISLWELVVPFLAVCSFPSAFSHAHQQYNILNSFKHIFHKKLKPYLKNIRDFTRNFSIKKRNLNKFFLNADKEKKKRALFLVFEPRHYKEIYTPLKEILSEKDIEIKTIGSKYRAAQEKFVREDLLFVEDFYSSDISEQIKKNKKEISTRLKKAKKVLWAKIRDIYPDIWSYFEDELNNFFIWEFSSLIKQIAVADEVINRINPNIIVGGDDCDPRARIYFLIGRNKEIPKLLIQQGFASDKSVEWLFLSVDKAAIFGNYIKRCLEKIGVDSKKLVITGQPRFDNLVKTATERENICSKYSINSKNKIILFTSQPNHPGAFSGESERRKAIETVYNLINGVKDAVLIVKPHPDEKIQYHQSLNLSLHSGKIVLSDKCADIHELIKACDLLITFHSTTALEAMIANKPVLIINLYGNSMTQYVESGAALQAFSENDAISKINNIFNNKDLRRELENKRKYFITEHAYNLDGKASERVINLMLNMMNN